MTADEISENKNLYIDEVIALYIRLPDTPVKPSYYDRITASAFFDRNITLHIIETALLLAWIRRHSRNQNQTALQPVRSLAYFVPVIQELSQSPMPDGYLQYLRLKVKSFTTL